MGNGGSIGTPSLGGGGGGSTRRAGGSAPRLTYFKWTEVAIGKIQAVTPKEGEAPRGPISDSDHIKQALGYGHAAMSGDTRPVLVYFHWPHDDPRHGKLTETVCSRTLDDEQAARWSLMFRCVQIDMGRTETNFAEQVGSTGEPAFVALDADLKVVATIPVTKSGSKLRKALEAAFGKFPEAAKRLKKDIAQQKKWLDEAKRLEKQDEYDAAVDLVDKIRFSNVRVSPWFEKAYTYGQLLAQKAEALGGG